MTTVTEALCDENVGKVLRFEMRGGGVLAAPLNHAGDDGDDKLVWDLNSECLYTREGLIWGVDSFGEPDCRADEDLVEFLGFGWEAPQEATGGSL